MEGICIALAPTYVSTRFSRRFSAEDNMCNSTNTEPCLTYLTFGEDASNTVYIIFHTYRLEEDEEFPYILYDTVSHGSNISAYAWKVSPDKILFKNKDMNRYVCSKRLDNLLPNTTYYFRTGWIEIDDDGDEPAENYFTDERKFKTLPNQTLPNEVCYILI